MKLVFSSIGSNYSGKQAVLSLRQVFGATVFSQQIASDLRKYFSLPTNASATSSVSNNVELLYKGRDAIELALKSYGVGKGDSVITQAFTCIALEEAITRTGATPIYADIAKNSLSPGIKELEKVITPSVKAVVIQHSLGFPATILEIRKWCDKNKVILIEDLAQAIGAVDASGELLGSHADAIILSFGRDKIIDGVSGGAVLFRKSPTEQVTIVAPGPGWFHQLRELLYPLNTWLIRNTYRFGVGKLLHYVAKKIGIEQSPMVSPTNTMSFLPATYNALIKSQLNELSDSLIHRRKIATIYATKIDDSLQIISLDQIKHASCLRFPLMIDNISSLVSFFQKHGVFVADRWYREAVDCGQSDCSTIYEPKSCPVAESVACKIITLPTHRHISIKDAERITELIKNWQRMN